MAADQTRSKTGVPGITVFLHPHRAPRFGVRLSGRNVGSFPTFDQAKEARERAIALLEQGKTLPSAPRWREQVGNTGIKAGTIAGQTMYRYEVNVTQPDGKVIPYRSQWFETQGQALVARQQALDLVNEGKPIGRDGKNWTELRYPIDWVRVKLNPAPDPDITVKDWAIRFYREIVIPAPIPEKFKTRYEAHLMRHIVRVLGPNQVRTLIEDSVALLEKDLDSRDLSPSKKTVRTTTWRMLEAAITNGIRSDNPVKQR